MSKIIAITCGGDDKVFKVNKAYVEYVRDAGMSPMVVTPGTDALAVAKICDGLIITGGVDLDPTFYGEDNIGSYNIDLERDDIERQLMQSFVMERKPIFGICRGFQLIARTMLGILNTTELDFYQHVNSHGKASSYSLPRNVPSHNVFVNQKELYGKGKHHVRVFVNSMHHQALVADKNSNSAIYSNELGDHLTVLGYTLHGTSEASMKGLTIIEAFKAQMAGCPMAAVQWHPEELKDVGLIKHFFEEHTTSEKEEKTAMAGTN
jgi:putative glutamine amidotransferase